MNSPHSRRWTACAVCWGLALLCLLSLYVISDKVVELKLRRGKILQMEEFVAAREGRIQKAQEEGKKKFRPVTSPRLAGLRLQEELRQIAAAAGAGPLTVEIHPGAANSDALELSVAFGGEAKGLLAFFDKLHGQMPFLRVNALQMENNPREGKSVFKIRCTFRYVSV